MAIYPYATINIVDDEKRFCAEFVRLSVYKTQLLHNLKICHYYVRPTMKHVSDFRAFYSGHNGFIQLIREGERDKKKNNVKCLQIVFWQKTF